MHAAVVALERSADGFGTDAIAMLAVFDHEEVGSGTRSGAAGPFLSDAIELRLVSVACSIVGS